MRKIRGVASLVVAAAFVAGAAVAQGPQPAPAGGTEAPPYWAYGELPPNAVPPSSPAGSGGPRPQPDISLKHIPGSTEAFTLAQLRDFFNVADWFPGDHPPMPDVVVRGRPPDVRGCAMCHMPNGLGRPENAPVAGLPYAYVVQQMMDFKNDRRTSAEPRKLNTLLMIQAAKAMTDAEIHDAATYLSSLAWKPWIRVVEADTVPKMRLSGNVFFAVPDGGTEPIGRRIIETPEDAVRFELRDPRSGFIAYVPAGSLSRGAALVASGGNKTLPCGICHGQDLNGLGPVPAIAGRSPSYIVRQLYDMQRGSRKGLWSPLMKPVVEKLTQDDMIAIAAYVASR